MRFDEFDFDERIAQGIQDAGFVDCTDVQEETFKILKEKRDVLAQSQTGTGKTAAFLIGSFQMMLQEESLKGSKTLVVVPTRELAIQVEREAQLLGGHLDFQIGAFYGGVGYQKQEEQLSKGLDILVGTPGRLIDFNKSGKIDFREIGIVVIDEADRLFDMGFAPDITFMLKRMKPAGERLTMLYSATMSTRVANLTWEHMREPGEIVIEPEQVTVESIKQELYHVGVDEKMSLLLGIFNRDKPESAVIFCNTRHKVYEVAKRLEVNGYNAKYLIGDLPQKKRTQIVDSVKKGEVPFLVATDVAARGLHIEDLPLVINYDIPNDAENYVHRIGRTARAGKQGRAISLACEEYVLGLSSVEEYIDAKIPVVWAEEELYQEDKSRGMRFRLNDLKRDGTIRDRDRDGRSRDGRNRSGKSGDGRSRDGRRDSKGRGGKDRNRSNRKPSTQVASVVSQAAGSMDVFEKDGKKQHKGGSSKGKNKDYKKSASQSQKGRKRGKGKDNRDYQNRDRQNVEKNINSQSSLDSRLEYYKKKYGEDFQPTHLSDKETQSGKGKTSKKSNKQKSKKNYSSQKQGADRKKKSVSQDSKTEKRVQENKNAEQPKKKGLFGRLFGK